MAQLMPALMDMDPEEFANLPEINLDVAHQFTPEEEGRLRFWRWRYLRHG
jgi:hypothetical protein